MARTFTWLSVLAIAFVLSTLVLGLALRLGDVRNPADRETQRWATVHRLSGVTAGLGMVLVNSIVVTYFIGTSRWCKEVSEAYQLDPLLVRRSNRLKRHTFLLATIAMLVAVGIVALGGAADPGADLQLPPPGQLTWRDVHFAGAALGLCYFVYAAVMAWNNIRMNQEVITEVLAEVKRIRTERGLEN